jgi:hypothetical protein
MGALRVEGTGNKEFGHTTKRNKYSTVYLFHSQFPTFYSFKNRSRICLGFLLTYYAVMSYDFASFI